MIPYDYVLLNFAPGVGLLFLLVFLVQNKALTPRMKNIFLGLLWLEALELAVYSAELWTSTFAGVSRLRILFSAIGYTLRPLILFLFILLVKRRASARRHLWVLALPLVLNTVAAFSAFFTPLVYSYTQDNHFTRGPLAYTFHVILSFYLIYMVYVTVRAAPARQRFETMIIFAAIALLLLNVLAEALYEVRGLGQATMVLATVFYYMYFQTQLYQESLYKESRRRAEMEHRSKIDGLTGLLNKNAFMTRAQTVLASPTTCNAALVFLDLDHFKQVNDLLGHPAGDKVICDAAKKLQSIFRRSDVLGRFGGDEFCALLPNIGPATLEERLQQTLSQLNAKYSAGGQSVHITTSIGVLYFKAENAPDVPHLLKQADIALYHAKSAGRNRYILKNYTADSAEREFTLQFTPVSTSNK